MDKYLSFVSVSISKGRKETVFYDSEYAEKGKSDVWYCESGGQFAGLVITINGPDKILLDYLAVNSKMRGRGIVGI